MEGRISEKPIEIDEIIKNEFRRMRRYLLDILKGGKDLVITRREEQHWNVSRPCRLCP